MEGLVRARGVLEGRRRDGGSHKSRWKMEGLIRAGGVMEGLIRAGGVMEGLTIRLFTQLDGPKFIEYISLDIQFHFCPVKINFKIKLV